MTLGYICRSGIVSYMTLCLSFEECTDCFSTCLYLLNSHQQCKRIPISAHPHQHLLFSVLFCFLIVTGILVNVKWNLIIVVICNSIIAKWRWEHFHVLIAIYRSFFGEISFQVLLNDWLMWPIVIDQKLSYFFSIEVLYQIHNWQIFFWPVGWLPLF